MHSDMMREHASALNLNVYNEVEAEPELYINPIFAPSASSLPPPSPNSSAN